ncbi:MAG TPA: HAMP domain-containing sensor histidine kinase [Pelobium sp.]
MNTIYHRLSKIPVIKYNYSLKFLFAAFIGIHIPLIGIIAYALNSSESMYSGKTIIIIALIFTLLSTAATLYVLNKLLAPLLMSDKALKDYVDSGTIPDLPLHYEDEAGKLMGLIQETIQHLDNLAKEKKEITTLVSHNLRTPLNQIIGLCELMKVDTENTADYVDKVEQVTKLQLRNLSDLLTQLMESGKRQQAAPAESYDIHDFLKREIETIADIIQAKELKLLQNFSNEDLTTDISSSNLSLAFQNLLSNAIKFSYPKGCISVSTKKVANKIEIEVQDEGIGFSDTYRKNIFKDARSTGRKGTNNEASVGLGLHLSKKIIVQSGGTLTAFSEGEGKGARFTIKI